ncbi:hypothetical protein DNH61_24045 [Paenibacillus sambharensis]|uniref:Uncharacterized protein n=1 Tax=Paenibacillus sambharensis TaxID=1803190 RepID=A0A2W1LQK9_9BACL|nr:hypothetical protein [Paenibacillus sambharensis]PZD93687.1 hypothetical protein DNH61_24045 [Paenibacillus sambharensis]
MIKYGSDTITELKLTSLVPVRIEVRSDQWVDIELRFDLAAGSAEIPSDLIDLTALVITNLEGMIVQVVPQDEGIDCEYQFTFKEKEQLSKFIQTHAMQDRIAQLVSGQEV